MTYWAQLKATCAQLLDFSSMLMKAYPLTQLLKRTQRMLLRQMRLYELQEQMVTSLSRLSTEGSLQVIWAIRWSFDSFRLKRLRATSLPCGCLAYGWQKIQESQQGRTLHSISMLTRSELVLGIIQRSVIFLRLQSILLGTSSTLSVRLIWNSLATEDFWLFFLSSKISGLSFWMPVMLQCANRQVVLRQWLASMTVFGLSFFSQRMVLVMTRSKASKVRAGMVFI